MGKQPNPSPAVSRFPRARPRGLQSEAGLPGYISNTAGTYVCNQTFYHSLHLSGEYGYRAGLIHVPYLPEQAAHAEGSAPSMSLNLMVEAVQAALLISTERAEDIILSAGAIS